MIHVRTFQKSDVNLFASSRMGGLRLIGGFEHILGSGWNMIGVGSTLITLACGAGIILSTCVCVKAYIYLYCL
jgi:hypothetical protein